MKAKLFIFSLLLTCAFILYGCSDFSSNYPTLTFNYSGSSKNYETTINGGNWFNKEDGGNSFHLGGWDIDAANNITAVDMTGNSEVELKLSSDKNLDYLKLSKIEGTDSSNQELIDIPLEDYKFKLPEESGIYSYVAYAYFDDTHNVKYVFKVLVKGITKSPYSSISENKDISSVIKEELITTATQDITLTFTNNSKAEYTYGLEPHLEVKHNNVWTVVPLLEKVCWNDIAYLLKANDKSQYTFSLKNYYGELDPGEYRIIKDFYSNGNTLTIPIEFEIQ